MHYVVAGIPSDLQLSKISINDTLLQVIDHQGVTFNLTISYTGPHTLTISVRVCVLATSGHHRISLTNNISKLSHM